MRILLNSVMAALVIAALFWGNCFSCPHTYQPAHRCCHHGKPATEKCSTQGLRHFVQAERSQQAAPAPAAVNVVAMPHPVTRTQALPYSSSVPLLHAPPDPLSLRI